MNNFKLWQKWVLVSGYIIVIMALIIDAIAFFKLEMPLINEVFWSDGIPENVETFYMFILGLYSCILAVFGIFVIFVANNAFLKRERWSWNVLFMCYTIWFIADSFYSLYAKVYPNFILNMIIYILIIIPLAATYRLFADNES